jgi:hypothetical protein
MFRRPKFSSILRKNKPVKFRKQIFFSLLIVKANLESSGQKSGNIFEGDDRDVEGVAEPDEPSALDGSVDVQATYNRNISKINFLRSSTIDTWVLKLT